MEVITGQAKGSSSDCDSVSSLRESIALLNGRVGWVPQGWMLIYYDMLRALLNLDEDIHEAANIIGPWIDNTTIEFTTSNSSAVVTGILRKASRRSQCTCSVCGAPGKLRRFEDDEQRVLCANCFAPREIAQQLALWIPRLENPAFVRSEQVFFVDDFNSAFLVLIAPDSWRWLPDPLDGEVSPFVQSKDLLKLVPNFKNLYAHVQDIIHLAA